MPARPALAALVLAALASDAAAAEAAPLAIRGREVALPSGCAASPYPGGARITCAERDWVTWGRTDAAAAPEARSALGAVLRGAVLEPGWTSTESEVPCRVAGVEATCTRIAGSSTRGRVLLLWAAAPDDGGGVILASCMSPGPTLGRACALVFALAGAR